MNDQVKEEELYTQIGQYLIDSLSFSSIEKWDRAIFTVRTTEGLTKTGLNYQFFSTKEKIRTIPSNQSRVDIYEVIDDLKDYSQANNYTNWNKFILISNRNCALKRVFIILSLSKDLIQFYKSRLSCFNKLNMTSII